MEYIDGVFLESVAIVDAMGEGDERIEASPPESTEELSGRGDPIAVVVPGDCDSLVTLDRMLYTRNDALDIREEVRIDRDFIPLCSTFWADAPFFKKMLHERGPECFPVPQ